MMTLAKDKARANKTFIMQALLTIVNYDHQNILYSIGHKVRTVPPGANVIKLFTMVIYCHSMAVIKLYYLGNYHGMAVNYHGIKLFYNIGQKSVL